MECSLIGCGSLNFILSTGHELEIRISNGIKVSAGGRDMEEQLTHIPQQWFNSYNFGGDDTVPLEWN